MNEEKLYKQLAAEYTSEKGAEYLREAAELQTSPSFDDLVKRGLDAKMRAALSRENAAQRRNSYVKIFGAIAASFVGVLFVVSIFFMDRFTGEDEFHAPAVADGGGAAIGGAVADIADIEEVAVADEPAHRQSRDDFRMRSAYEEDSLQPQARTFGVYVIEELELESYGWALPAAVSAPFTAPQGWEILWQGIENDGLSFTFVNDLYHTVTVEISETAFPSPESDGVLVFSENNVYYRLGTWENTQYLLDFAEHILERITQ
jgi:hypothetical protein